MQSLPAVSLPWPEAMLSHRAINFAGKCEPIARKRLVSKARRAKCRLVRRERAVAAGGVVLHEIKNVLSSFA